MQDATCAPRRLSGAGAGGAGPVWVTGVHGHAWEHPPWAARNQASQDPQSGAGRDGEHVRYGVRVCAHACAAELLCTCVDKCVFVCTSCACGGRPAAPHGGETPRSTTAAQPPAAGTGPSGHACAPTCQWPRCAGLRVSPRARGVRRGGVGTAPCAGPHPGAVGAGVPAWARLCHGVTLRVERVPVSDTVPAWACSCRVGVPPPPAPIGSFPLAHPRCAMGRAPYLTPHSSRHPSTSPTAEPAAVSPCGHCPPCLAASPAPRPPAVGDTPGDT